jgi:hypothetical protein
MFSSDLILLRMGEQSPPETLAEDCQESLDDPNHRYILEQLVLCTKPLADLVLSTEPDLYFAYWVLEKYTDLLPRQPQLPAEVQWWQHK